MGIFERKLDWQGNLIINMRKGIFIIFLTLLSLSGYFLPDKAEAIPYFSRKYNTECTVCHTQFPRLNAVGMAFKQKGYRLEGEDGGYVWQDKLFPFSGMAAFKYKMLKRTGAGWAGEDGSQSIFLLDEMEFLSAGTLAPNISYYLTLGSEEEQPVTPGVAFIIFDDILDDSRLNIKAGKFNNEFLYLADKRRFTLEPYSAPVTRTQYGVEINGGIQSQEINYALGMANDELTTGKALDGTEITAPAQASPKFKDISNDLRAYYGWVTYSIAGQTLGIRGYTSKTGQGYGVEKNHTQFDTNLNFQFDPVILTLAYYTQTRVFDQVNNTYNDQKNLLAEMILKAGPQLIFDLRYELQDKTDIGKRDNKYVVNTNYYISPNISLTGELFKQNGKESQRDENKFQLGVLLVF